MPFESSTLLIWTKSLRITTRKTGGAHRIRPKQIGLSTETFYLHFNQVILVLWEERIPLQSLFPDISVTTRKYHIVQDHLYSMVQVELYKYRPDKFMHTVSSTGRSEDPDIPSAPGCN